MPTGNNILLTYEQATQRLPLVRSIVRDIVDLYADVHDRRRRFEELRGRTGSGKTQNDSPSGDDVRQMEQEIERLEEFMDELRELGAELKDPVRGLVDFRSLMDDREVYLCWHLGEHDIAYWHELNAGFAGRQSLLERSVSGDEIAEDGA